jgi:rubrerythrin
MTNESHEKQGGAVPLNWACTNCGYRIEDGLPEKCPECGADREIVVTLDATPVPTLTMSAV